MSRIAEGVEPHHFSDARHAYRVVQEPMLILWVASPAPELGQHLSATAQSVLCNSRRGLKSPAMG